MSSIFKWASKLGLRVPSPPRQFANTNFIAISSAELIEEETIPGYVASRYYPVHIGEVFDRRYQVVGKLGFGSFSTVWLARDLNLHRHVALKVFIQSARLAEKVDNETTMFEKLDLGNSSHPGRLAVRTALDTFKISGPDGEHQCLVHTPLWDSLRTYLARNPVGRLPGIVLRGVLIRLLKALDYIHTECKVIHTDIKADNLMFGITDNSIFEAFETAELATPSPRKISEGRTIYATRELGVPTQIGKPILCDFGVAVSGEDFHDQDVQPNIYRSPEVILRVPWSYEIDVWNVGAMIWDIFEDKHLFNGIDPEHHAYRSRAHLAEMVAILGPHPLALIKRGKISSKFFDSDGNLIADIQLISPMSLELSEEGGRR